MGGLIVAKVVSFVRSFLGNGLKSNVHLQQGVVTGILQIAKEGIFSELNNLDVYTLLDPEYSQYFGLSEQEVDALEGYRKLNSESHYKP
jgi:hypothetical protein